jgi:membrane-associated phospholipid phosphatase
LFTDYVCFGCLPWVQSRPPRALESEPPWKASWRAVNLHLLERSSVGVNTFPSGHAAEGLICALLVTGTSTPIVVGMFVTAAAISAGAVLGRYHYAADAIFGWFVALIVWAVV